jgi:myo-inositol 2-dehydrogenase / D-chiro-inositol 1-dehydrogenase
MGQRNGLQLGIVGVGRIGVFHARTLVDLPDVASVTVADADRRRAAEVAAELDVPSVDTPETLVDAGIDALVIATATPGHAPLLRLAARAGLPAFCEKPVALDLPTMDGVLEDVRRAGILVQIGFQRRFDAGYRAAHEAVAAGSVGRILVMRAATHDPSPPSEDYIAASGGIFRDLHIHDFDAVRFVSGDEVADVYADGAVLEAAWFEPHGDVDVSAAVVRLTGGGLVIVSGTRHDPLGYDVRLEVFGTADSIAVGQDDRSPIRSIEQGVARRGGPTYRDFMDRFGPAYRRELAAFVAAVRDGAPSACSLEEARAALVIALAAERSRAERRPVSIEAVDLARGPATG